MSAPREAVLLAVLCGIVVTATAIGQLCHLSFLGPMHLGPSICVLALTSSFLASAFRLDTVSRLLTVPVITIGISAIAIRALKLPIDLDHVFTLIPFESGSAAFEGRTAFTGSAICTVIAVSLCITPLRRWGKRLTTHIGALSTFVSVGSFIIVVSKLAGLDVSPELGSSSQIAIGNVTSFMLVNLAFSLTAFRRCQAEGWRLNWTSYPSACAVLVGTLILASAHVESERKMLDQATKYNAKQIRDQFNSRIASDMMALDRMGARMKSGMETDKALWELDAAQHIHDNPEFQAIEWIDSSLHIRWIQPLKGNETAVDLDSKFEKRRLEAVENAINKGTVNLSKVIDLVQGGKGFLIYAPIVRNGHFVGMIAGVCRFDRFVSTIPAKLFDGYGFQVVEKGAPITSQTPPKDLSTIQSASLGGNWGVDWQINAWPLKPVNPWHSPIVILTVAVGFVLAFLAFFVLVLLEKTSYYAKRADEGRRFLEGLSESSVTPTYVFDLARRRVIYTNRFGYESLGLTEKQILDGGLPLLKSLVHPDDWAKTLQQFGDVRKLKDGEIYPFEHRIMNAKGEWRWIAYRECVLERTATGEARKILLNSTDITEQKESERLLAQAKEDLEMVLENAPIGMAIVGIDGRWIDVNPALCEIVGYTKEELLQTDFQTITHPDDLESDLENVRQVLSGEISTYSMEKRYYHKTGQLVWILLCVSLVRYPNGKPHHFISQIQDISDRKLRDLLNLEFTESLVQHSDYLAEANSRLEIESRTDPLTGLANRRYFGEQFSQLWHVAERYDRPLSTIMLDVDHFKSFNDEFGHTAGDVVLQHVAVVLREICREVDLPARWGGEEFVVLCPETDLLGAAELAERLRRKIAEIDLPYRGVTASFGVAFVGTDPTSVFDRADAALYAAKQAGRNRVVVDEPGQPQSESKSA